MKNIWKYLIPAVLGIVIGVLGALYFQKPPDVKPITETVFIDSGVPDSVWQQKVDSDRLEYMEILLDKQSLEISNKKLRGRKPETIVVRDTVYKEADLSTHEFVSEKTFAWDAQLEPTRPDSTDYVVKNLVTAFSPLPVRSFESEILVRWNKYYELNVLPQFRIKLKREKNAGKFKGLLIGAIAIGGLASGNDIAGVAGLALAGGLYIFW